MVYSFSYLFLSDTVSSERYFFFSSPKIHLEFIASFWGKKYFIWFCGLLLVWDSVFSSVGQESSQVQLRPDV